MELVICVSSSIYDALTTKIVTTLGLQSFCRTTRCLVLVLIDDVQLYTITIVLTRIGGTIEQVSFKNFGMHMKTFQYPT